jgi:hypothetical protein
LQSKGSEGVLKQWWMIWKATLIIFIQIALSPPGPLSERFLESSPQSCLEAPQSRLLVFIETHPLMIINRVVVLGCFADLGVCRKRGCAVIRSREGNEFTFTSTLGRRRFVLYFFESTL